jgi:hypothetical protein
MTERDVPTANQEPSPKEAALVKYEAFLTDYPWHSRPDRPLKFRSTDFLYKGKQALPYDYLQVNEQVRMTKTAGNPTENQRYLRISEYDGVDSEMRHVKLSTHYVYDYQTGHLEFSQIVSPDSYISVEQTRKLIEEQPELYPSYRIAEEGDYEDNHKLWEYLNSLADSLAAHAKYTAEATAEAERTIQKPSDEDLRRLGLLPGIRSRQLDLTKDLEGFDVGQAIAIGLAAAKGAQGEQYQTPNLKIKMSDNDLLVNGKVLETADGPEVLQAALVQGREKITRGLEKYKERIQKLYPDAEVSLSPFKAMELASGSMREVRKVLTKEAIDSKERVFPGKDAVKEEYLPFWDAIVKGGFEPHIRLEGTSSGWDLGLWAEVGVDDGLENVGELE